MTGSRNIEPIEEGAATCNLRLIHLVRPLGTESDLDRGAALFYEDDEADSLIALLSGCLEISILSAAGRKTVLNVLTAGQVFGELSLLEGTKRTATAIALQPSRVLRISRAALMQAMAVTPQLAIELLKLVIQRGRWISEQFETLAFEPLEVRLARRLLYLRVVIGDDLGKIEVSQHALGDHVGASREAVSKVLAIWKRQGLVATYRGGIIVVDIEALNDRAEGGLL